MGVVVLGDVFQFTNHPKQFGHIDKNTAHSLFLQHLKKAGRHPKYYEGAGKDALEKFGKTKFYGIVHQKTMAGNIANEKFYNTLADIHKKHDDIQDDYDYDTNHGVNQSNIGGENVIWADPLQLCSE